MKRNTEPVESESPQQTGHTPLPEVGEETWMFNALVNMRRNVVPDLSMSVIAKHYDRLAASHSALVEAAKAFVEVWDSEHWADCETIRKARAAIELADTD